MEKMTGFSIGVSDQVKHYVYRLIDPRNGQTFYVGKGQGNRVFAHANGISELDPEGINDEETQKIQTIRDIRKAGLEVIHTIHRHGMDNDTALQVEAALIDAYGGLTNIANGVRSNDYGVMHVQQIEETYKRETIENISENVIIIKISPSSVDLHDGNIYEATRQNWKMSLERAETADYVFSVMHGVVQEVYKPTRWYVSTEEGRIAFEGEVALSEIRDKYVGNVIPQQYRRKGMASPCLYVNM